MADQYVGEKWRENYATLATMTEDDLAAAVATLPANIRARLSKGPLARRYACGVCEAFGEKFLDQLRATVRRGDDVDMSEPMVRAYLYHEVPKKDMHVAEQQWYGPLAAEVYERTLATYRAAGWSAEADG